MSWLCARGMPLSCAQVRTVALMIEGAGVVPTGDK
jgi:hypothetical protein